MKTIKPTNRRKFLAAAGLGGAGVAAAVVTGAVRKPEAAATASAEPAAKSGYHVSEHILKYYKTTQV